MAGATAWLPPAMAADVTIYRCTDGKGRLTLRDTPCRAGEKQETRAMARPQDPPPRPAITAAPTPAPVASASPPRTIVLTAPQPLYECTTPDGEHYTSDTAEGNPRWVELWTLGFPVWRHRERFVDGGIHARVGGRFDNGRVDVRVGTPSHRPPPLAVVPSFPAGTWIRDECHALPQQEICDRLRDRRWELDRRYNSALQSERTQISLEQRGIDARLSNDCGGS
ncbi:MAG TPA: DUF4124 domain-containing protein [Lysobacter sp.]